ncbi:MAG TPA: citrate/2-methylcitrate synthase [Acidimicrobiales bacterium]|nr:citrate/2-methylcitrate synthase [Acidimicrobiales bacterium]
MTTETTARTIADVMTAPAVTATPDETLGAACARMQEKGVGSVVVVEGNRPVGILTERDLVKATASGAVPETALVAEHMTVSPDCVHPDTEITEAWVSLATHGYRHFPVTVAEELKGIVSLRDLTRLAQIRPVDGAYQDVPKGLEGVVVAETTTGAVRGLEGFYHYRQYSAVDLARSRSFEDVWQLLFDGELPGPDERRAFADELRPLFGFPDGLVPVLRELVALAPDAPVLDHVRSLVSAFGAAVGLRPSRDSSRSELRQDCLRIGAAMPVLVAAAWRLSQGLELVEPRPDLGFAAGYLWLLTGTDPSERAARAVERYLTSTIDHGLNASTFTARVVASTGADVAAAVVSGIAALSGPLHGGAPSRALDALDAIGTPERADAFIRDAVRRGERIMGFGHRVYRTVDPRSELMKAEAEALGGPLVEFAEQVEDTVVRVLEELKPGRSLYANVEFYAGVVMELCGIPRPMFTPTFALSRTIGWCAHILEQAADNRIIRPASRYVGPPPPVPVPPAA